MKNKYSPEAKTREGNQSDAFHTTLMKSNGDRLTIPCTVEEIFAATTAHSTLIETLKAIRANVATGQFNGAWVVGQIDIALAKATEVSRG